MKNATTAADGEEKTYKKPNIHIWIPQYSCMYLNHFAGEHIAHFHPTINWAITWKKKTLFESQGILHESTTIFTSPTGNGTAILRGHPSDAKV